MVTEIQCHQNPQPSPCSPAGALSLLAPQLAAVATLILRQPWRRNDARLGAASTRRTTTSPPSETPRDLADFQSRHGDAPRFAGKGREIAPGLRRDTKVVQPDGCGPARRGWKGGSYPPAGGAMTPPPPTHPCPPRGFSAIPARHVAQR